MGSEVRRTRVLIPALLLNNCVNLDPWLASVGLFSQVKMGVIPLNSVVAASSGGNQRHRCPSFRMQHTVRPVAIDYGGIVPTRLIGIIVPEFAMSTVPLSSLQAGEARQVGYSGGRQGGTLQTPCPAGPCHLQLAVRGPGHMTGSRLIWVRTWLPPPLHPACCWGGLSQKCFRRDAHPSLPVPPGPGCSPGVQWLGTTAPHALPVPCHRVRPSGQGCPQHPRRPSSQSARARLQSSGGERRRPVLTPRRSGSCSRWALSSPGPREKRNSSITRVLLWMKPC